MPIDRFDKIHNVGLFKDFTWPVDLENFSKFNLIYGGNGTGKTTLSRILNKLGNAEELEESQEIIISDGEKKITESDFSTSTYGIKVFNRDFVSNYILTEDSTEQIIYIGEKIVRFRQDLKTIETKLDKEKEQMLKDDVKLREAREKMENFMSEQASDIKNKLYFAGSGINDYQYYNRLSYNKAVEKIIKNIAPNTQPVGSNQPVKDLLKEIKKPSKDRVEKNFPKLPDLNSTKSKLGTLLQTKVVNKAIERLQHDSFLSKWTKEGLEIYNQSKENLCPWCEQELPENKIAELTAHFNDSFNELLQEIDDFSTNIDSIIMSIPDIKDYLEIDLYSKFMDDYKLELNELAKSIDSITKWLNLSKNDLEKKRLHMNIPITLSSVPPEIDVLRIERVNEIIMQHNHECDNHNKVIINLCEEYEKERILEHWSTIMKLKNEVELFDGKVRKTNSNMQNLEMEIFNLKSKAQDSKTPLKELNKSIAEFLGHKEIQFDNSKSETGYILCRDGHETTGYTLSEGEQTIISLLYFLKSLNDSNFDFKNAIIVFDDPISSLDSNYFHHALVKILEASSNAKQSFIFTHNFAMFAEIKRRYASGGKGKIKFKKNSSAYMLEIEIRDKSREGTIMPLPQILSNYDSDYYFLFDCLLNVRDTDSSIHKWHYNFPNMARRFLETFLEFKYPGKATFSKALESAEYNDHNKETIRRYLNKFSHRDDPATFKKSENPLPEARQVASYILDMVKKLDDSHYNQMKKIVTKSSDSSK